MPNPVIISPVFFFFSCSPNNMKNAPIPTIRGAKKSGENILPHSLRDTIQAVIVVPILAPIMTPTACVNVSNPALTNPTTITVVAELLWIIAVMAAPISTATNRFLVRNPIHDFTLSPADF